MEKEKFFKVRGQYVAYNDSSIQLTPRNQTLEGILSFLRGLARALWFVIAGFALLLCFVIFVQPAKLSAVLKLYWLDLKTIKTEL